MNIVVVTKHHSHLVDPDIEPLNVHLGLLTAVLAHLQLVPASSILEDPMTDQKSDLLCATNQIP